jgi:hypothetical protein
MVEKAKDLIKKHGCMRSPPVFNSVVDADLFQGRDPVEYGAFFTMDSVVFRVSIIRIPEWCLFLTMDSVVLGLASSGCGCCTVPICKPGFCCPRAIGVCAIAGDKARPCV